MMPATLDTALTRTLQQRFAERVALDEPMSRHTSWHVGGPAEVFF